MEYVLNLAVTYYSIVGGLTPQAARQQNIKGTTKGSGQIKLSPKQMESVRRIYFDFGKPCSVCSESYIDQFDDTRCLECFQIKCLNETCLEDNDCKLLKEKLKEGISDVTNLISKQYLNIRQNEDKVAVKSYTTQRIHEVKVDTTIKLSKWVGAIEQKKKRLTDNSIKISITGEACKDDVNVENRQKVYVRLEEMPEFKPVGLYEKGGTSMELNLIKSFEENLNSKAVKVSKTNDILEYLEKADGPAIIVCLHQSRIQEDIRYTLGNVQEIYYSRLILVLLHFKIKDTDCLAADMQQYFSNLKFIDYFQHQEIENMAEVIENVNAIIFSY